MANANSKIVRLLIIHPALPPYRLHLFNALANRCQLKLLFLLKNLLDQKYEQEKLVSQLKAEHGYLTRGFVLLKRTFRYGISDSIKRINPDAVVTTEFSPATIAVAINRFYKKKPYKHIVWTDDNPESIHRDTFVRRFLRKVLLPRIDGLICLSQESASLYQSRFGFTKKIGISPILHDESIFRESIIHSCPLARELIKTHSLENKRILLFVGRLAKEKRVDRLLRAFALLRNQLPETCVVLVGDGPLRGYLQGLSSELGLGDRVIFPGHVEGTQLYAWYRLGGVFAIASEFEPFGAVVNEALLAGMPVVCSNKAGARVLIKEGLNGSVVDSSDSAQLKLAIKYWLQRTNPLSLDLLKEFPPSLMVTSFQKSVEGVLSVVIAPENDA